jgi:putative thioredoxin
MEPRIALCASVIPAVYAFKDGRPVDGFVEAQPESQIKPLSSVSAGRRPAVADQQDMAKEAAQAATRRRTAQVCSAGPAPTRSRPRAHADRARRARPAQKRRRGVELEKHAESRRHARPSSCRAGARAMGSVAKPARLDASPDDHEAR